MKSRSRRSSSKPPERARGPAGGAAQKRRTTVQQRRQRTRPQTRLGGWASPLFAKNTPYPVSGAPEKENAKINRKRFFARIRQTARSKAARRENAPVPECAGLPRTNARGFSAVLTISRKAGRPSGGTVLLLHLSGGP